MSDIASPWLNSKTLAYEYVERKIKMRGYEYNLSTIKDPKTGDTYNLKEYNKIVDGKSKFCVRLEKNKNCYIM